MVIPIRRFLYKPALRPRRLLRRPRSTLVPLPSRQEDSFRMTPIEAMQTRPLPTPSVMEAIPRQMTNPMTDSD
jgi:hypothetical protein